MVLDNDDEWQNKEIGKLSTADHRDQMMSYGSSPST